MSEWSTIKLGDVLEITNGYAFKSVNFRSAPETGCLPVLKIKNVANGDVHINDVQYHLFEEKLSKYTAQKGDILISLTGNHPHAETQVVGAVSKLKMDIRAFVNQRVAKIDTKPNLADKDYIYFALKEEGLSKYLASQSSGSANQANISKADIEYLDVALPPLPEQKAIASVLSSLDDKIDLLHRQNKTLEAMAETLFRQWFIEEAKEDWEEVQVKDFVALNKVSVSKSYPHTEIEYLDTGSLTEGVIGELQNYQLAEAPSRAKRLVQHNDILISTVRPNQCHYGIISEPQSNLVVSTGFCTITCERISPYFVYLLLTNKEMTEYLHSIAEGSTSTYPSLKPEDIGSVSFQLPHKELIQQFHGLAESYWQKIHKNHKQIQILEKLRDTLLPKLMSGEVRVQYQT